MTSPTLAQLTQTVEELKLELVGAREKMALLEAKLEEKRKQPKPTHSPKIGAHNINHIEERLHRACIPCGISAMVAIGPGLTKKEREAAENCVRCGEKMTPTELEHVPHVGQKGEPRGVTLRLKWPD